MKIPNVAVAYRESAALGVSGVGIVVLLYDRLVQDMHGAAAALTAGDIEARAAHVNHALLILQQLQGRLDFAAGSTTARQLDAFYSHLRGKLLEAQIKHSPEVLLEQVQAVTQVRECWAEVERQTAGGGADQPAA